MNITLMTNHAEKIQAVVNTNINPVRPLALLLGGDLFVHLNQAEAEKLQYELTAALDSIALGYDGSDPDSKPVKFKAMTCHDLAPEGGGAAS